MFLQGSGRGLTGLVPAGSRRHRARAETLPTATPRLGRVPALLRPEQLVALLEQSAERLAGLGHGRADDDLLLRSGPQEWSPHEVLAHLRACADVWGDAVLHTVEEDAPTLRAVNPRTYAERTDHLTVLPHDALAAFAEQRRDLVVLLRGLPQDGWPRSATVTGAGRPRQVSVHAYVQRLAVHERPHVAQAERALRAPCRKP